MCLNDFKKKMVETLQIQIAQALIDKDKYQQEFRESELAKFELDEELKYIELEGKQLLKYTKEYHCLRNLKVGPKFRICNNSRRRF